MADGAFDLPEGIATMEFCRDVASYVSTVDFIQRANFRKVFNSSFCNSGTR